uniref:Cytochrome c biogenesis protein Ccs1 n=1 Tax=Tisochrysis lutea TaxID=1321669 RepID=A0A3S6R2K4_9EUKA|nr:Ccs1 [Tisochrysis lutea]AUM82481.1 Ccs1 [Tisochrysis lutea]
MSFLTKSSTTKVLKQLASLKLAIILLSVIGILISLGTFIEQGQSLTFYKENYPSTKPILGFIDWHFITKLQLNTIYTNFWFLLILIFFGASLLACTYTTQIPSLKKFRLWEFIQSTKRFQNLQFQNNLSLNLTNTASYYLRNNNYHVFRQGKKNYSYSGLLGRIGPILVHFSILFILVGSSLGALGGYTVQEIVPRGEVFHLQNFIQYGRLTHVPQTISWRVNDFWITYTDELKVNQFYSDLSALDTQGNELKRKIIFVNEPFVYKGISIYQTDWDVLGIKLKVNDKKIVQIPLKKINKSGRNFWVGLIDLGTAEKSKYTILLNDLTGQIYLYNLKGELIEKTILGKPTASNLIFTDFITTTGLQIKSDPGLQTVYFSFALLIMSIYVSFFSYSQIWGLEKNGTLVLGGKANRAVLAFQEEFRRTIKKSYGKN